MQARIIDGKAESRDRGSYDVPEVTVRIHNTLPIKTSLLADMDIELEKLITVFWYLDGKRAITSSLRLRDSTQRLLKLLGMKVE